MSNLDCIFWQYKIYLFVPSHEWSVCCSKAVRYAAFKQREGGKKESTKESKWRTEALIGQIQVMSIITEALCLELHTRSTLGKVSLNGLSSLFNT